MIDGGGFRPSKTQKAWQLQFGDQVDQAIAGAWEK